MKEEPTTPYKSNEPDKERTSLWHGLGLFGESYLLFSIGTLKPIWAKLYPSCFDESDTSECKYPYLSYKSVTYSVVIGVMSGMVLLGFLANSIGRRRGSILTASLMAFGAICMTLSSVLLSSQPSMLFPIMSLSFFVFGTGVGGEYPLSASSASERAMTAMCRRRDAELDHEDRMQRSLSGTENNVLFQILPNHQLNSIEQFGAPTKPLSSTNTTGDARNSLNSQNAQSQTRGREVLMVFSMQGAGIFANSLLMTFFLMLSQQRDKNGIYDKGYDLSLLNIWRTTYVIGTLILVYVVTSRIMHLTESEVWANDRAKRDVLKISRGNGPQFVPPTLDLIKSKGDDCNKPEILSQIILESQSNGSGSTNLDACGVFPGTVDNIKGEGIKSKIILLLQHYGFRLFGTSLTWLLWDISFYGNKLFQSSFLLVLFGEDATLMHITGASAINAFVALLGYYTAATLVDNPNIGRLILQQVGFIITGTLFLLCGFLNERLSSTWLLIIYLASSFFGQCGPNCTTFLIPAEIFPTEMRTMCHGISAFAGKLGALIASVLFNFVSEKQLFLFSGYSSFIACCITFMTIPETATLDLYEIDKQWRMILDRQKFNYKGSANDPKHLSFYERNHNEFCCLKE